MAWRGRGRDELKLSRCGGARWRTLSGDELDGEGRDGRGRWGGRRLYTVSPVCELPRPIGVTTRRAGIRIRDAAMRRDDEDRVSYGARGWSGRRETGDGRPRARLDRR